VGYKKANFPSVREGEESSDQMEQDSHSSGNPSSESWKGSACSSGETMISEAKETKELLHQVSLYSPYDDPVQGAEVREDKDAALALCELRIGTGPAASNTSTTDVVGSPVRVGDMSVLGMSSSNDSSLELGLGLAIGGYWKNELSAASKRTDHARLDQRDVLSSDSTPFPPNNIQSRAPNQQVKRRRRRSLLADNQVQAPADEVITPECQGGTNSENILELPELKEASTALAKRTRRGPQSGSCEYRGVTFYKRTSRWESHIW
jgi:hypothetical protein